MTPATWERVYHAATRWTTDKNDGSIHAAEGRIGGRWYRIIYDIDADTIIPITIIPITGFPIARRAIR